jgi:geranylgeranyl diphosphate synthase type I
MTNQLKALAAHYLPALEAEMQEILSLNHVDTAPIDTGRDRFYEMIHYHMGWLNAQLEADNDGRSRGKRIRPLLCLLVCDAVGGSWEQALPAAAAVEILHNFTLVHDDIEDASPTRHGRPTVWQLWGEPQAINVGDAMFALSHLALTRLADCGVDAAVVVRALRRFDETCLRLTEGQHADMSFERMNTVSVDAYLHMITGKTAVLLGLCGELGALVGGGDEETIRHYAAFGKKLGLAFQVKDDILGIWGDEALTGKSAATDIETGKKSLPVLYGLSRNEQLRSLYAHSNGSALSLSNGNDGYVRQVISLLDESGAYDFAAEKATEYSRSALDHLEAAQPAGGAGKALYQLTEMLLTRNY